MRKTIANNGWIETDIDYFWIHRKNGKDTGLTIAHISPRVYHVRYYPPNQPNKDFDVGSRTTLANAKKLAESALSGNLLP